TSLHCPYTTLFVSVPEPGDRTRRASGPLRGRGDHRHHHGHRLGGHRPRTHLRHHRHRRGRDRSTPLLRHVRRPQLRLRLIAPLDGAPATRPGPLPHAWTMTIAPE